jgi:hypothetical protein
MGCSSDLGKKSTALDRLGFLETEAACNFFRAIRGMDVKGKWEEVGLGNLRALLDMWVAARGNRQEAEYWATLQEE